MPEIRPGGVVTALSWAILVLLGYANGGGIMPFLLALRSIRIKKAGRTVGLTAMDAMPMAMTGFGLWAVPPLLLLWSTGYAVIGGVAAVVVWFGFRLSIQVAPEGTRVIRTFAFVIPWTWRSYREVPHAFTDGWGDFADPESINIEVGEGKRKIEVAWGDKWSSTRCDDLAAKFNDAVAALSR